MKQIDRFPAAPGRFASVTPVSAAVLLSPQLQTFHNRPLADICASRQANAMAYGIVEQWHPVPDAVERKALILDLSWQGGEKRVIATVWFANKAGIGDENISAVIIFEDVFAFKVFDENMELSGVTEDDAVVPKSGFPWGGRWPYLEVHASDWIRQLAEHDGAWKASEFRHLVITTESLHLHVACRKLSSPSYHFAD